MIILSQCNKLYPSRGSRFGFNFLFSVNDVLGHRFQGQDLKYLTFFERINKE